ncbi:MAG TPA: HEAT repeat domain-containing protein [Thermoanaerobaculia bacterium]|jgi:HEAT repeat protein|nr:HEAT repeat domain-containing protein [Thermoanaerobaculia bacterium]
MSGLLFFLLPYAIGALAVPFVLRADRRRRKQRRDGLQWVVDRLELTDVSLAPWRLVARHGRRRVRIEQGRGEGKMPITIVTVEGNSGISLRPEPKNPLQKALGEREIELGDEGFDAAVWVHGAPDRVRALLDVETRATVMAMLSGLLVVPGQRPVSIRGRAELVHGDLQAKLDDHPQLPTEVELADALGALLAIAERFDRPPNLAARLAGAIENEPEWRVRLQGLQILSTSYPNDPATAVALRHGLLDEQAEVRLHAAIALGDEGRASLLDLVQHERIADTIAAQAVGALGDRMPADVGVQVLRQALRTRRLRTCVACVQAVEPLGGSEARELLVKMLTRESGELAVAAAHALGRYAHGGEEIEDALIRALERDEDDVRLAAIEALGHMGSARAVMPVEEAERAGADAEARRAARQAVAEIQSRLPGASAGQLSIAGDDAGRLSLADDDPRGRVSLSRPAAQPRP